MWGKDGAFRPGPVPEEGGKNSPPDGGGGNTGQGAPSPPFARGGSPPIPNADLVGTLLSRWGGEFAEFLEYY